MFGREKYRGSQEERECLCKPGTYKYYPEKTESKSKTEDKNKSSSLFGAFSSTNKNQGYKKMNSVQDKQKQNEIEHGKKF